MPPKKATTAAAPKKSARADGFNLSYQDMIKEGIINLKERNGSSRQTLKKYLRLNFPIEHVKDAQFTSLFNRALAKGSEDGTFARPKGPSGPVKLGKPPAKSAAKPAAKATTKKTTKTTTKKEDAPAAAKKTTKATTTKKAPAAKKATTKTAAKSTTAKATTKKAPAAKANTSKKAAPKAAPAVEEQKPVVMTKTKTGRVVKSAQPQKADKPKKAAATKKAAPKKAAAKK